MEGGPYLSNQGKATNGCEEGHNHGRDLTNGELSVFTLMYFCMDPRKTSDHFVEAKGDPYKLKE